MFCLEIMLITDFIFLIVEFSPEQVPVVLAPLLYPDSQDTPVIKLVPESVNMPKTAVSIQGLQINLLR